MVEVARAYETRVGFDPNVAYQELLGLMISERQQEASDRLEHIRARISGDHPIQSRLVQMATLLRSQLLQQSEKESLSEATVDGGVQEAAVVDVVLRSYSIELNGRVKGQADLSRACANWAWH